MAGILSTADVLKINQALDLVFDTFALHTVSYEKRTLKRETNREDNNFTTTSHTFTASVEYRNTYFDEPTAKDNGYMERGGVVLSTEVNRLIAAGLYDTQTEKLLCNDALDYFSVDNKRFKVVMAKPDGYFELRPKAFIIRGIEVEKQR